MKYDLAIGMLSRELDDYRRDLQKCIQRNVPEWADGYRKNIADLEAAIALLREHQTKEEKL